FVEFLYIFFLLCAKRHIL
ncbi:hypothetical protein, partial [Plasmodium yoelii yoelii]